MEPMKDPQVKQLVETIQRLEQLRGEAKQVASEYRDRIQTIETEVSVLAESIRSGQKRMFDGETGAALLDAAAKIAPRPGSEVESVEITSGKSTVTLTQADGERLRKVARKMRGAR
jgi:hypothetical protein